MFCVPQGRHLYGAPYRFEIQHLKLMAGALHKWRYTVAFEVGWIKTRNACGSTSQVMRGNVATGHTLGWDEDECRIG